MYLMCYCTRLGLPYAWQARLIVNTHHYFTLFIYLFCLFLLLLLVVVVAKTLYTYKVFGSSSSIIIEGEERDDVVRWGERDRKRETERGRETMEGRRQTEERWGERYGE